MTGLFRC